MRKWLFGLCLILTACGANAAERNNTGNYLTLTGKFDEAVNAYQVALVQAPDNPVIYFNSAIALADSEQIAEAEASIQQAIERGDDKLAADSWYNLGNIYFGMEDYEQAITAYRHALLINPNHENARYNLEIANARLLKPTPTSMEMQVELTQEQVNPTETPTPNPAGETIPSPTPTPPDVLPPPGISPVWDGQDDKGEAQDKPTQKESRPRGELDIEDAKYLLKPIEASYERISTFRDNYNQQDPPKVAKDW